MISNKREIICLCTTYYQLIVICQLSQTIFKDCCISLVLTDHSTNSDRIYQNLIKTQYFKEVFFCNLKKYDKHIENKKQYFQYFKSFFCVNNDVKKLSGKYYDYFLYYDEAFYTHFLFTVLTKANKNIKCDRFEEGILAYNNPVMYRSKKISIVLGIRKFFLKRCLTDTVQNFYCFYSNACKNGLNPIEIPKIDNNYLENIRKLLSLIFDINPSQLFYPQKYIYFSSIFDTEGGDSIGEIDLIKKIASIVGKENLLVKIHPRDDKKRFLDEKIEIDVNSSVPWEVIQLNCDFSKKYFITSLSGSVFLGNIMFANPPKTIVVYKLCDTEKNTSAKTQKYNFENLLNVEEVKLNNVFIPENFQGLKKYLLGD